MSDLLPRLSAGVLLPPRQLAVLVRTAPFRYKEFQIPKRKAGEFRTIAQPAREVKALQYWVLRDVLANFKVHNAAMAYRKGRSILHNAKPHAGSRFLLKMDFRDFFPSFKADDLRAFLKRQKTKISEEDVTALCQILFWMPKASVAPELCLSIGAPTSPALSNILMFDFDLHISTVAKANRVKYTRYADDLTFSAMHSESLSVVESAVHEWCAKVHSPKLAVHQGKTVRVSRAKSRRVTGLVLTNDRKVSLGRDVKRLVRAQVHHFLTGQMPVAERSSLRGMLHYVNSVEPAFLDRLRLFYGTDAIDSVMDFTVSDN